MTNSLCAEKKAIEHEFLEFRNACVWMQHCFNIFNHLYVVSDDDTEAALRQAAVRFFTDLNMILQEYLFIQVRRITDEEKRGKKTNLSIRYLNARLSAAGLLTPKIERISESIYSYREIIREVTNQVIVHNDKEAALADKPFPARPVDEMEGFVRKVHAYTDAVSNVLGIALLDYRAQTGFGDVSDLTRVLKRAMTPVSQHSLGAAT